MTNVTDLLSEGERRLIAAVLLSAVKDCKKSRNPDAIKSAIDFLEGKYVCELGFTAPQLVMFINAEGALSSRQVKEIIAKARARMEVLRAKIEEKAANQ